MKDKIFRHVFRSASCLAIALALATTVALAEDLPEPQFRLAPGDVIAISIFANNDLSGSYPLREDGSIALHLIGSLPVGGRTPAEVEQMLRDRLKTIIPEPISTTVSVSRWRPVALLGAVAQPGMYEFSSGLDVMRAVALAGGSLRLAADAPVSQAMRVTEEAGRYLGMKARLAALLLEESRLLQERAGATDLPVPPEVERLVGAETAAQLAEEQVRLMDLRRQLHEIRTQGEEERAGLSLIEAQSFADRRSLSKRQIEEIERDLEKQRSLREQGLTVAARYLEVTLAADQYRSNELEAAAFEAAARQSASAATSAARGLVSQREEEITQRLTEVRQEIAEARATMAASRNLLAEFGGGAGLADPTSEPRYLVTRRAGTQTHTYTAGPVSLLQPGDTLEVIVDPPALPEGPQ
ncbi:polysaccharide biosynthesis/export family protein [Rhodobacter sp. CZR27]|uniref:polysaccharide biosynthesis/export family protein n=1 Tax=Rhodobacter sp. CZR27 TaxID=2033869 RepID=UPI000BBF229E|nr:polysaccharide biosynthesis/export family protein [Rhodobacter sp. CZR27]